MTTVMDHASPWLSPSRALATTTQAQLGATPISSGTGSATTQPAIRSRREILQQGLHEGLLGIEAECRAVAPLEADGRRRVRGEAATADGPRVVRRIEEQVIRQTEQALGERAVERPRHALGRVGGASVEVGPARVADQQGVAGKDH